MSCNAEFSCFDFRLASMAELSTLMMAPVFSSLTRPSCPETLIYDIRGNQYEATARKSWTFGTKTGSLDLITILTPKEENSGRLATLNLSS